MQHAFLAACLLALVACDTPPAFVLKRTLSGRAYKVQRAGQVQFGEGGGKALLLLYQTDRPLSDRTGMEAEARDLLALLQPEADRVGLGLAIVQANSYPKGMRFASKASFAFEFERRADGSWSLKAPASKP